MFTATGASTDAISVECNYFDHLTDGKVAERLPVHALGRKSHSAATGRDPSPFSAGPSGPRSVAFCAAGDPLLSHCDSRSR
jgi:hypothetical protein